MPSKQLSVFIGSAVALLLLVGCATNNDRDHHRRNDDQHHRHAPSFQSGPVRAPN